jgi:hypothetical protein
VNFAHPTVSARLRYRPSLTWNLGVSASAGSYLASTAAVPTLAPGHGRADYRQLVLGHDLAFAWHHWQVWAEVYAARFEIPVVGQADTVSYYVETRYKLSPQLSAAVRWNEQLFGSVPDRAARARWGKNVQRLDFAPAWRFTPHTQLKLQYSLQDGDAGPALSPPNEPRDYTHTLAAQFTLRF